LSRLFNLRGKVAAVTHGISRAAAGSFTGQTLVIQGGCTVQVP
jgi:hypothetical protein